MIFKHRISAAALLAAGAMLFAGPPAAQAEETCISDWSKAASIVREKQLESAADVAKSVRKSSKGRVLSIALCENDGKYVYRLTVTDKTGSVKTIRVTPKKAP